jgi:hypothetical protein
MTRQGPLARRLEQALGLQARLEPQELLVQGALPGRPHGLGHELQVAPRVVDGQPPADLDELALARLEVEQGGSTAEHGTADQRRLGRGIVLQGKVAVPAGGPGEAGQLSLDRDGPEAGLELVGHGTQQGGHAPGAARPGARGLGAGSSKGHAPESQV